MSTGGVDEEMDGKERGGNGDDDGREGAKTRKNTPDSETRISEAVWGSMSMAESPDDIISDDAALNTGGDAAVDGDKEQARQQKSGKGRRKDRSIASLSTIDKTRNEGASITEREGSADGDDLPHPAYPQPQPCTAMLMMLALAGLGLAFAGIQAARREANDGDGSGVRGMGRGVALPAEGETLTRLAFGSCSEQLMPHAYWDTVAALAPDVLVLTGDNVYGDCLSAGCPELGAAYEELASKPSFKGAMESLAVEAVWDDHDYGQNDGGSSNPYKQLAKQEFLDFWRVPPGDPRRHRDGIYTAYQWGPNGRRVQLILLDTRWFRSDLQPSDTPGELGRERYMPMPDGAGGGGNEATMLGEAQWSWLRQQLLVPGVDLRVVVSSVQLSAESVGWEAWWQLPREMARFFALVEEAHATAGGRVVVISGDRHVGAFYHHDFAAGGDGEAAEGVPAVVEVTASSWTHTLSLEAICSMHFTAQDCRANCTSAACDEPSGNRRGPLWRVNNFATVDIDWESRTADIVLRAADWPDDGSRAAGQVIDAETVQL